MDNHSSLSTVNGIEEAHNDDLHCYRKVPTLDLRKQHRIKDR